MGGVLGPKRPRRSCGQASGLFAHCGLAHNFSANSRYVGIYETGSSSTRGAWTSLLPVFFIFDSSCSIYGLQAELDFLAR
jgi:hypothetical protein